MPTSETDSVDLSAEKRFRNAFERLKLGVPEVLPKGTSVSQRNVAREAGCSDPSALRKERFPLLVIEIQEWVASHGKSNLQTKRQKQQGIRNKNRSYRETIADFKLQRDQTVGLLAEANLQIVFLTEEIRLLRARLDAIRPTASVLNLPELRD
ncbi:MAG: hypothetical protein E6R09_12490 [Rhodocyclaceae bacterium]|nr:MAG: hypothetical protein E6R09_12490 [Rhodocyclaceae bacterium]